MSAFYTFAGEHPVLTFVLAAMATSIIHAVIVQPFKLAKRLIRSRNIAAHGWPPAHLDADGDCVRQPEA